MSRDTSVPGTVTVFLSRFGKILKKDAGKI